MFRDSVAFLRDFMEVMHLGCLSLWFYILFEVNGDQRMEKKRSYVFSGDTSA